METKSLTWRVTPDLLGILSADGRFRHTNPAWFTTLGRQPEDIESRLFFDFIHPEDLGRTAGAFAEVQKGNPVLQFENRYRHKDGSYRWLSWNAVPDGEMYFCNARDITAAKETEAHLARHAFEAQLREQFIAVLGHDLRNPLAGAACAVQFLERESLSKNGGIMLRTANDSLQRMSALIDDVLDFARTRLGGDIGVEPLPGTHLRPVLENIVAEIRVANPSVIWEEAYEFDDPVTCDPARIAQLVSNLLGNAIFHGTPDGTIRVHARDDGDDVAIAVTNTGGTIPPDIRALLFEPFKRAEPGSSQNGLGLGLFICKQIADGHEADLSVESRRGETTFTLTLPRMPQAPIQGLHLVA
ncbi:MAG: PAS domain-containing sensor histidine kinase [Jannaschia sp.]